MGFIGLLITSATSSSLSFKRFKSRIPENMIVTLEFIGFPYSNGSYKPISVL